jgi:hypothetical protein
VQSHVDLLGILTIVWGGLSALLGLSVSVLGAGAAAILVSSAAETSGVAAAFTALILTLLAILLLAFGGAHVWAGRGLRRYRPSARVVMLLLAVPNIFILPFGTALSLYTIWVLLSEESRQLFDTTPGRIGGTAA